MPSALFDDVYSAGAGRRSKSKQLDAVQEELEFSEYDRSPNFAPGWYIVPIVSVWLVVLVVWLI